MKYKAVMIYKHTYDGYNLPEKILMIQEAVWTPALEDEIRGKLLSSNAAKGTEMYNVIKVFDVEYPRGKVEVLKAIEEYLK